jgi:hypothetical protein
VSAQRFPAKERPPPANCLYGIERRTEETAMHAESINQSAQDRRIGLHISPESLSPRVLEALRALGYSLDARTKPDLAALEEHRVWIVDAERLPDFPDPDTAPDARLLLLTQPEEQNGDESAASRPLDPRIFAQTSRPGRLGAIYGMIQSALERTPRRSPRIPTQLSARCIRSDRRSIGAVLSLSEGGCLLRTSEIFGKGTKLDLQFALPAYGLISTAARCCYMRRGDAGLEFDAPTSDIRHTIAHYVTLQLATQEDPSGMNSARDARSA